MNKRLLSLLILVLAILMPMKMWAQEPYAVLSDNNTVLTFYYDNKKEIRNGMDIINSLTEDGEFTGYYQYWMNFCNVITTVVFDQSFANCNSLTDGMMPPEGKHWQFTPDKLDEMDARGEIYWSSNGNPRRKVYLDQSNGVPVQDIWLDYLDVNNQNTLITGYPTEKNIDMLKRIIETSSRPGDPVLDCFAGSGTTLVAAEQLGRQ